MNYWQHSLLSRRKFGGEAEDYLAVHRFLDSSKYFYYHLKHRLILHNLYGIELAAELLGDTIQNSDGNVVLVRDVGRAHCREDLAGRTPTLYDWLETNPELEELLDWDALPRFEDEEWNAFLQRPYLRSGRKASLLITYSDFGVKLTETFFGAGKAGLLRDALPEKARIKILLDAFVVREKWQFSPDRGEIVWLRENELRSGNS